MKNRKEKCKNRGSRGCAAAEVEGWSNRGVRKQRDAGPEVAASTVGQAEAAAVRTQLNGNRGLPCSECPRQ